MRNKEMNTRLTEDVTSTAKAKSVLALSGRAWLLAGALSVVLGATAAGLSACGGSEAAEVPVKDARYKAPQDPSKIWTRSAQPVQLLDTPEIQAEVAKARAMAGEDEYLLTLQRLQTNDFDDTYTIVQTPGANVFPVPATSTPGVQASGRKEVPAEPTKVFDNVYYVGGMEVGGWLIDTGDGYIMLDSSYDYGYEEILIPGMRKLGLDPSKVKYILITHAGPDHVGATKKFQDNFGTKIIFQAPIIANPTNPNPPTVTVAKDGDTLTLGDTTITIAVTPRNVGGTGLSFFIPVRINGEKHMWATYGNTGITGTVADKAEYTKAIRNFIDNYVARFRPDIAMSSHPFVDGSTNRMAMIREYGNRIANPFIIGEAAAKNYFEIMAQAVIVQSKRQQAGLNASGTGKL
jgi:metallo-beta-lactamase class B